MNEFDKKVASELPQDPQEAQTAQGPENNNVQENPCTENECVETQSPAEMISETTDQIAQCQQAEACVETESPALEIAGTADNLTDVSSEQPEEAGEDKGYFSMSKEELVDALTKIVESGSSTANREVAAIKQAYFIIHTRQNDKALEQFVEEGGKPEDFTAPADETESKIKELLNQFKIRRAAYLEQDEANRKANLAKKQEILDKIKGIADDIDNINLRFTEFQQLQQEFKAIKEIPASADTEIWKNYQLAVEQFYDRLKMNKELRDLDFKRNLEAKLALAAEAEALAAEEDVIAAFRKLQDLHVIWRELGPVAKELREEIWNRFKTASTVINKRHQDFFEARKIAEAEAETKKKAIIEKASQINIEALDTFKKWDEATKTVLQCQAEWKESGFASRKINNTLFTEFRKWCDDFFQRKGEYYNNIRAEQTENYNRKLALCTKAEELRKQAEENLETADFAAGLKEIINLQEQWKKIGAVARKNSDAIWNRFLEACNYFYDQRKKQHASQRKEENTNLAAKREVIAQIRQIPSDIDRNEGIQQLKALQDQWQSIGHVPFKAKDQLYSEYREACDALYQTLNLTRSRARMGEFKNKVANLVGEKGILSERDKLVRKLEAKRAELHTMENNLGFFNIKSSSGSAMLKDMQRRMNQISEEIALVESQIKLLDEKKEESK